MNSISHWQRILLQEIEETSYEKSGLENPNLADLDKDKDISSWEKKRGSAIEKNLKEDNFFGLKVGDTVKFKDSSDRNVATVKYNVKNPNAEFEITALHHGHPEVPDPNTHADLKDKAGNEIKKVYTGYLEKVSIQEGEDHEVSMANNSIETIIKHAMELKAKLGNDEKDIPAWIQDHITNAANFISQAAENYHEYGQEEKPEQETEDSLTSIMEKIIKNGHK